jgi:hypothetical protein
MIMRAVVCVIALTVSACIDFTVTKIVGGTGGPKVLSTVPADIDQDVSTTTEFTVVFSTPMQRESLHIETDPPMDFSNGFWEEQDQRVTVFPTDNLAFATSYTATINGTAVSGGVLTPFTITFATQAIPNAENPDAPPTVTALVPANSAANVSLTPSVSVTFSKPMDSATVTLTPAVDLGEQTWSSDKSVLTYAPLATMLLPAQIYSLSIDGLSADTLLPVKQTTTFTTLTPTDNTAPSIHSTSPPDGTIGVPTGVKIAVIFTEPMQVATVNVAVTLHGSGTPIPATCAFDGTRVSVTCTPSSLLPAATVLDISVIAGALDDANNAITGTLVNSFTTGAGQDSVPPSLDHVDPMTGTIGILPANAKLTFYFTESMGADAGVVVFNNDSVLSGISGWNPDRTVLTWTPSSIGFNDELDWTLHGSDPTGNDLIGTTTGYVHIKRQRQDYLIYALAGASSGHIAQNGGPWPGLYVGDWHNPDDVTLKSYLTFNLNDLLAGLTGVTANQLNVSKAVFVMYPSSCSGYPTSQLSAPLFTSTNFGATLLASAYATPPAHTPTESSTECASNSWGTLPLTTCSKVLRYDTFSPFNCAFNAKTIGITSPGGTRLDVVAKVRYDLLNSTARGMRSQWALEFTDATDTDQQFDYIVWYDGGAPQAYRPQLKVTYEYP